MAEVLLVSDQLEAAAKPFFEIVENLPRLISAAVIYYYDFSAAVKAGYHVFVTILDGP
jgi:hypothetical protein